MAARNTATGVAAALVAVGMVGAAFAAVPAYRLFCQVTGYGGTTKVASAVPGAVGERVIRVQFDANIAAGMPWDFRPEQREVGIRAGEAGLAFYLASNPTDRVVRGAASYNVSPQKAGRYFSKVQCFCFDEQTLEPGETVEMGVTFFLDPAFLTDHEMNDVDVITLSYTFFEAPDSPGLASRAVEQPQPARVN